MRVRLLLVIFILISALDNGVGRTPPMGWNAWNRYNCNINEKIMKRAADMMVESGLAAKGYKYINLDDCWALSRNSTTHEIIADRSKFPSGIASLAEYVHSKNLLFGLYSSAGNVTCAKRPGSLGYE